MRKNVIHRLLLIVAVLSCGYCNAQDLSSYSPKKLRALGDNAKEIGDVYSAIDFYKAYCSKKKDPDVYFQLAECYRNAREYILAANYYNKTMTADKKNLLAIYHYAEMLKVYGYYDEAKSYFLHFKQKYKKRNDYKRLAAMQISACDSAKKMVDSAKAVELRRLDGSINKQSIEFSPLYIDDTTLLYASLRTDTALYVVADDKSADVPYRHFYIAKKRGGDWRFFQEWMEGDFNQDNAHCGNGVFSPDKKKFFFTKCEYNWKYKLICKICMSTKRNGTWTTPEELPSTVNMKKYTNTQPAIGTNSKTGQEILYFVSDRDGGRGGKDIWYSEYSSAKGWQQAKNCGNRINTSGDEVTPHYQVVERKLFFSSNGMPGLGEFDVFSSVGEANKWTAAENLGAPINSGFDDLYYSPNPLNTEGFFTSNRQTSKTESTCCDDIFSFKYVDRIHVGIQGKVFLLQNQTIADILSEGMEQEQEVRNDSIHYIEGTVVSLFMVDDVTKEKFWVAVDTTDEKGSFFFDVVENKTYALQYESSKLLPPERIVSTHGMTYSDTITVEDMGIDYLPRESFVIKNIYYEFDKAQLTMQAKKTIKNTVLIIMKEFPQIVAEIGSHTDSKGSDAYNIKLSQKRAESVVNYLIENGIEKERLRAKGYGETKPIAPNQNEDGSDNPAGRAKNRRTEFRVIGTLRQYFEIIYEE